MSSLEEVKCLVVMELGKIHLPCVLGELAHMLGFFDVSLAKDFQQLLTIVRTPSVLETLPPVVQ
jgi:hypothetical protein